MKLKRKLGKSGLSDGFWFTESRDWIWRECNSGADMEGQAKEKSELRWMEHVFGQRNDRIREESETLCVCSVGGTSWEKV